jgi:hypothetical protein
MGFNGIVETVKANDLTSFSTLPLYSPGLKHMHSGNEYVYVYNGNASAAIGTGKYCVLEPLGTSLSSGYTVTVSNASLNGWMMGVAQNTINTATYGWVMTKGVSLIAVDSGEVSAAPGVDLALGTTGGFVAAGATFSTAPRFGVTINSFVTTVGTSKARIFGSIC